jgi:hypothetical protein
MVRAARNQTLYREVNEKIEGLNEAFAEVLDAGSAWICECADTECTRPLEMTLGEYEHLRTHPDRFAVAPGHVYPDVERVVDETDRYQIVEKLGVGSTYAIERDPRARERSA